MAGTSGGSLRPGRGRRDRGDLFAGTTRRRSDRSGVDEPAPWRSRRSVRVATALTGLAGIIFVLWLAWVGYLFFARGGPSGLAFDPDRRCTTLSFSCGILTNLLASVVLVALASSFLLWRLFGLQRRYRARARDESRELVPTAGAIIDKVVGRDDLCKAVMADLHDRGVRPHVLVGGVGTGKTAVLVRLTELLAEKRAIPVPVKLRDATTELDFEVLARERFLGEVNPGLLSGAEGETIWRRLIKDRKIIVLADGLEEALVADPERDNIIRAAIRKAHQQHLPLVIASRPHDPLRATEAAMLTLEPLSYEAALAYIAGDRTGEDERRLAWIVETAEVIEAPLYLQITRELQVKGLLEPASAGQHGVVDTRGVDRSRLRLGLLQTWERALIRGHLREEVPLNRSERHAAIEHLSALACAGLKLDRLEVEFDDLRDASLTAEVQRRLAAIDEQAGPGTSVLNVDTRLAAAWAAQLDLVELRGNSIRFPHSLMQAYLGSRLLDTAWRDPAYVAEAVRHPKPSRELLIALVLRSRGGQAPGRPPATGSRRSDPAPRSRPSRRGEQAPDQPSYVGALRQAATGRDDNKVLDIYAAVLELDSVAAEPEHVTIAAEIGSRWTRIHAQDPRTLEEGKIAVVHRFGEAARAMDERRRHDENVPAPAYPQLYAIGCTDRSYPVQVTAAQELGVSGLAAYQALRDVLAAPCPACARERSARGTSPAGSGKPGSGPAGPAAPPADQSRSAVMSAWLAPMLAGSFGGQAASAAERVAAEHAQADLAQWLRHLGRDARQAGEDDLPLSLEIALAQGFKYAANQRPGQPDNLREARMYLAEQALEMLKSASYWFSQLTLLHALCLLNLSEGTRQPADKRRAQPEAIVRHWLDVAGRDRPDRGRPDGSRAAGTAGLHPFVREAAQLVVLALKTRRPQRYCWIDESGVVGQVGSRNLSQETPHGRHHLWIPPSAGWTALDGRAQQLVADVLLLLNLADRGGQASERERRLKRSNRSDLPPCITHFRDALEPGRTIGTAVSSAPGISCVDGCAFELCPYPPKGTQPRVEMSEAFCRRQQTLVIRPRDPRTGRAPWQQMRPAQLTRFWVEMADRARGQRLRSATSDRNGGAQ
jgi:hypothetical protein